MLQRLGDVDAAGGVALRDDDVRRLGSGRGERAGEVGRVGVEADELRCDPGVLEAGLLDLCADIDPRHLRVDDRSGRRVQLRLREGDPRAEHRVVGAEERELVLLDRVDGQERDSADDRLLTAECGVEGLVTDGDGTELDDRDALVVRELLAALRPVFLRGGREVLAEDQLVTLHAAEVHVDVLDGETPRPSSSSADENLAPLRVDRADHDRRELALPCRPCRRHTSGSS